MKKLLVLALLLMTAACSRLDVGVRFADTYMMYEADRFFDLTSAQDKELKPDVKTLVADVRREDFPKLANFMEKIATSLKAKNPDRAQMDLWFQEGREMFREALSRLEPLALKVASFADERQERHFAETFRKETDKLRGKYSTPEKALRQDRKRAERWLDFFAVDLNREQEKGLKEFLSAHPTPVNLQTNSREKFLAEFLATPKTARPEWIHRFYRDPDRFRTEDSERARLHREEALKDYLVKLWASLNHKQRGEALKMMGKKIADLRRLALPAGTSPH
ncbi:MAG: hypothetical protein KF865_09060 [Bdellovibrionaceae bacterium]|nr:hypothetical protein [Pseudobdellovibrionaceae bacterium]